MNPLLCLSYAYVLGVITTFFLGFPTVHMDLPHLNTMVDNAQRLLSSLIWPFYWPMRLGWTATHPDAF